MPYACFLQPARPTRATHPGRPTQATHRGDPPPSLLSAHAGLLVFSTQHTLAHGCRVYIKPTGKRGGPLGESTPRRQTDIAFAAVKPLRDKPRQTNTRNRTRTQNEE